MEKENESHEEYAARIAGIPVDQVTPEMRRAAKELRLFSMYGGKSAGSFRCRCVPLMGSDFERAQRRLLRNGQVPESVLVHDFARQEAAAHVIHSEQLRSLVESGARILPGSTSTDAMVSF